MAVESEDDRMALLEDFGIIVEIAGKEITAVMDNGFEDALGTWVTVPVLTVRTSDVTDASRGDSLTIDNIAYTVAEIQPDGQGISNLVLQRT